MRHTHKLSLLSLTSSFTLQWYIILTIKKTIENLRDVIGKRQNKHDSSVNLTCWAGLVILFVIMLLNKVSL